MATLSHECLDMMSVDGTPGSTGIQQVTREEQGFGTSSSGNYDVTGTNPLGRQAADAPDSEQPSLCCVNNHKIATWNVRGMNQGKLDIVKNEMTRLEIDILGITELHWTGSRYFVSDDFSVYYSGRDIIQRSGVAFVVQKNIAWAVESFQITNEHIMSIRI